MTGRSVGRQPQVMHVAISTFDQPTTLAMVGIVMGKLSSWWVKSTRRAIDVLVALDKN